MSSRSGGYESLPAESQDGASNSNSAEEQRRAGRDSRPTASAQPAEGSPLVGAGVGEGRPRSGGSMDEAAAAAAPSPVKGGSKLSSETAKAGEKPSDKKDPTGGLPTAEGVFVGDPVSQSAAAFHTGGGGGGGYNRTPTRATVITSAPPAYSNDVAAAVAAANVAGGDGRGIAIPYQGGGGGAGQHTVIVMNAPAGHQFGEWGRLPQPFVCRACGYSGMSVAMTDPCSNMPILAAACCCLVGLWPCSFVPFLIPELRDTVHRCPNCQIAIGRSRQFR
ncbi:unnamed protein product [Scytosiphon promiscuus]